MKLTFRKIFVGVMFAMFYIFITTGFASMLDMIPDASAEPVILTSLFIGFSMFVAALCNMFYMEIFKTPGITESDLRDEAQ